MTIDDDPVGQAHQLADTFADDLRMFAAMHEEVHLRPVEETSCAPRCWATCSSPADRRGGPARPCCGRALAHLRTAPSYRAAPPATDSLTVDGRMQSRRRARVLGSTPSPAASLLAKWVGIGTKPGVVNVGMAPDVIVASKTLHDMDHLNAGRAPGFAGRPA